MKASSLNLRGVLVPFPTPFRADDSIDVAALRSNIKKWNRTGIVGYVTLGSTGERVHLDEREFQLVIETSREAVPRELAFIAGAGQQSTRGTIDETRVAARAGADAVLVITPNFYRAAMTQEKLLKHYLAVADASPVPLVLYSIPQNTGLALAPETVARLGEHENIIGIKDSSGDLLNFAETLRLAPENFVVLTGHAGLLYAALTVGAAGAILAAACVVPRLAVSVYQAVRQGAHEAAQRMQQRLAPVARAVTTRYGVGGLKVALEMCGYTGGRVRAPLEMPDEEARLEIRRLLEESALTRDDEAFLSDETSAVEASGGKVVEVNQAERSDSGMARGAES
ncbi:MAG TPA: dihydrodipicolinate synthase family protein [Pyrinomonadaceae bacterium]